MPVHGRFEEGLAGAVTAATARADARDRPAPFRYPAFDPCHAPESDGATEDPPRPAYSEDQLAAAVAAAREQARAEAEAETRAACEASLERQRVGALETIATELTAARTMLESHLAARAAASRELALAVARALVPEALAREPIADVEAMVRDLIARLQDQPRLELRLAPELAATAEADLRRAAEDAGYHGLFEIVADPALSPGDARLLWQDGLAARDLGRLEAEAAALVDAWLPADRNDCNEERFEP